jgi:hypothetical protein
MAARHPTPQFGGLVHGAGRGAKEFLEDGKDMSKCHGDLRCVVIPGVSIFVVGLDATLEANGVGVVTVAMSKCCGGMRNLSLVRRAADTLRP